MLAQTARRTSMCIRFITLKGKMLQNLREDGSPWMPQPLMPQGDLGARSEGLVLWEPKGIEITGALTSEHLRPGVKILDGKANRVKFNGNVVVTSETSDRN